MKYNHIIYNSSQTNREGRPGFGERAVTIGIDPSLLTVLAESDIYSFEYSHPRLSPNALASDPALIRLIEPSYFFTSVEHEGKKSWVLGRKIAVGFDYMFYANGAPTRLGNYVADIYAFDSVPPRSVFEALYENPAPGSAHFIPTSPEPRAENIEMRAISLDKQQDLVPEDRTFNAASLPAIAPEAVKLLFAFYAHLTNGRPVAAVINDKDAPGVIASFMRLIPEELISRAGFITNYNQTGIPKGYAIVCVDPENASEYFPAMWNLVDLTDSSAFSSTEASQLQPEFDKSLGAGDMQRMLNLSRWLFCNEYRSVKDQDEQGREIAYRYTIEQNSVTPQMLDSALHSQSGVKALSLLINGDGDATCLDAYFDSKVSALSSVKDTKALIDNYLKLNKDGLHGAKAALLRHRKQLDSIILDSTESFIDFFSNGCNGNNANVLAYGELIDLDSLKTNRNSMLSMLPPSVWKQAYPLFFSSPIDEKALVERTITDKMPDSMRSAFLFEAVAPTRLADICVALMKENDDYITLLLPILCQLQDNGITAQGKYFDIFSSKRSDPAFTDLFIKEYSKSMPLSPVEKEVERIELIAQHPLLLRAVTDVKLSGVLKALKSASFSNGDNATNTVAPLCDRLTSLPVQSKVIDEIKMLSEVLRGTSNADALKIALLGVEIGKEKTVMEMLPNIVARKLDKDSLKTIADFFIKSNITRTKVIEVVAKAPEALLPSWLKALYADVKKHRGTVIITELTAAGLSSDKAQASLGAAFPEDYKAYLKSLQPNIFSRFCSWAKSLFSKEKKADERPDDTPGDKKDSKPKEATTTSGSKKPEGKTAPTPESNEQNHSKTERPRQEEKAIDSPSTVETVETPNATVSKSDNVVPPAAPDANKIINNEETLDIN